MLQQIFLNQARPYAASQKDAENCWKEIEAAYTSPDRHFHNLDHLRHLLDELLPLKDQATDWETLFFSLCYHDVVYDVASNLIAGDNEERSAVFAERQLTAMHYPAEKIQACKEHILATRKHRLSGNADTNLLTDADLSILGQPWEVYQQYKSNIRKEYQIYPDSIFYAGRKKMLEHFLRMECIYKTPSFRQRYEEKAKENLRKEYRLLQA